jgi:RHH-type proline utilization regulon transcriptional repressor/proline dehydrogenase/delta 1-pyrroline-5-carboxylate dehydrogenase
MSKAPSAADVRLWVAKLHEESQRRLTDAERREQHKYATLVQRRGDKVFLSKMLDESSQIRSDRRLARRIKILIDRYGVPEFFSAWDAMLLRMYRAVGYHFDFVAIPIIKRRLRRETASVVIDEARPRLTKHLAQRHDERIGQNVNLLGEVVLGNEEADGRYRHYLEALESPDINYISVKISGIYAQTHALNYKESFPELVERMSTLYRKAIEFPYTDFEGKSRPKFINLDMEEYKDSHLTMRVFKEALSRPEFRDLEAGIVVQAYLHDAWEFQSELLEFAKQRVAAGGAPIKMRLVKGANLEMESVMSSLRGWPNPIYSKKVEVDASYMKILDRALMRENAKAVKVGVASHNLFSIAYAFLVAERNKTLADVSFEMLEGMANHIWRAQAALGNRVILYTPVVKDEHFLNAISYLVRRMDENTGPENFLAYSFNLVPDSDAWKFLDRQFTEALALKDKLDHGPVRTQDRREPYKNTRPEGGFSNEPDTDFDLAANQRWTEDIVARWMRSEKNKPMQIPLQIGAQEVKTDDRVEYRDRCQDDRVVVCKMSRAGVDHIRQVIDTAAADPAAWRKTTLDERHEILLRAADNLSSLRGDLVGCMCAVTGKTITEGDVEVSEAIDFTRFYPTAARAFFDGLKGVRAAPKGTVLVISPWNFPCAIPTGGVVAALAGGNTVILKPATVAAPVAWTLARAFWDAGVPREALQVVIADRPALAVLNTAPEIKHIILTGGTDTARAIATANPSTPLSAETGGKNAIILTASGDRDHAILNVVASAFGNAGQKCSACSLLLVEGSVYDDPVFRRKLRDAAESLRTGSVWDTGNVVGPMITNQNDKLLEALDRLEPGEEWLVPPRFLDEGRYMLAPTIKWGVRPENFAFRTELFGPMLSVVRVRDLEEAVRLVNGLEYGLTSGLQSLDEDEIAYWKENLEAGNLYINRGVTGAIVNRQPFGGMKLSAFGGGIKAGGPNYVSCFLDFADHGRVPADIEERYEAAWESEFAHPRDINNLYGEQNVFRYLPLRAMILRVRPGDSARDATRICIAARICGTPLDVSIEGSDRERLAGLESMCRVMFVESDSAFAGRIPSYERIRVCSPAIPDEYYRVAAAHDRYIATAPPVSDGRVELLHYIKEQSISYEYHRYGNITEIPPVE